MNTASGRGTADRREHLHTYGDLLAWAHHAELLTPEETLALARLARSRPGAARRTVAQARILRETLHAIFEAIALGQSAPAGAVARLNQFVHETARTMRLEPTGGSLWRWRSDSGRLDRPFSAIVRSAAELLISGPLHRVKVCPGHACGWIFLDQTRNGRRRWCEMEVCGSRAKMSRYRRRRAAGGKRLVASKSLFE